MDSYAPPPGPPTPHVPEGWKAVWNDQYKEWFYVNIHTKQSQWDKPSAPALPSDDHAAPPGAPPGYSSGPNDPAVTGDKKYTYDSNLASNNPYSGSGAGSSTESDAALAARLQREEDEQARNSGRSPNPADRGASDTYYAQNNPSSYPSDPAAAQQQSYDNQQLPAREEKSRGFLGKLLGKGKTNQQGYGGGGYPQQGGYGGGYGGGGYGGGGYPQQQPMGYGGYPQQGGYYPQQGGYMQQPPRRSGLGAGGGAALGLGGGLLGGMLLGEAMDGGDGGGDGGGDYGGGDGGGGGDFGGGDGGGGM